MKGVRDDFWPEPQTKTWQNFDNEGMVHKEFVPPGQVEQIHDVAGRPPASNIVGALYHKL